MRTDTIELLNDSPGRGHRLSVWRFGPAGARPQAYLQAALHADEVPAILVASQLRAQLEVLEARGSLRGEVVVVPFANPLGLGQTLLGQPHGRFDLQDGGNFNRGFADLSEGVLDDVDGRLGDDPHANQALVRAALRDRAAQLPAATVAEDLKRRLQQLALQADVVLDLHCDTEAVMHLYALTPQRALAAELGADLGAGAVLLATDSGGSPFDESCTRPWHAVQQRHPDRPVPMGCFAATIELRGQADTAHATASGDAAALIRFLHRRGLLEGPAPAPAEARCSPTPLNASEPVLAPHAGVVVFHRAPGERLEAGDPVADVLDPESGRLSTVRCASAGVLYARSGVRWAHAGKRLAKIAGTTLQRSGALLSP